MVTQRYMQLYSQAKGAACMLNWEMSQLQKRGVNGTQAVMPSASDEISVAPAFSHSVVAPSVLPPGGHIDCLPSSRVPLTLNL